MSAQEEHPSEGAPEWMVSYADMITIMMAFFVVMYAMAGTKDPKKQEPVMSSMRKQFGRFVGSPSGPAIPRSLALAGVGDGFQATPTGKKGTSEGRPSVRLRPGDQLTVGGAISFAEGESEINDRQKSQLLRVAREIAGKPQKIEVRGHTSSRPLADRAAFGDHWALAYARSHATLQFLVSHGVEAERVRLSVAAGHEPAYTGHDPQLIAGNNRVEIFMLNEFVDNTVSTQATNPEGLENVVERKH